MRLAEDPITLEIQIQILVNKYQKSKINSLHTCIKIDSKPSYLKIWKWNKIALKQTEGTSMYPLN